MEDSSKYLIHANFVADGVIERSDVVGAIFGQTEGLLGDGMDLRDLQQASRVGRIDVEVDSESGRSHGTITIATSLDQVETAILAAALETIERVGPCRSQVRIDEIEDVRAAKRREVVERAKELLTDAFDESIMDSQEILEEVRGSARVEEITDYHGLPAGPRVETSDAIIVVEGRADVLALLRCGIKNAIAVEGTNVPDAVAELTRERTVTAFLDGDRGGELILRELDQVGDVDYVVFAPERRSVEDLPRHELMALLRDKRPIEELQDRTLNGSGGEDRHPPNASPGTTESSTARNTDGAAAGRDESSGQDHVAGQAEADDGAGQAEADDVADVAEESSDDPAPVEDILSADEGVSETSGASKANRSASAEETASAEDRSAESDSSKTASTGSETETGPSEDAAESAAVEAPPSLREHVREVVDGSGPGVRLLDASLEIQATAEVEDAFDALSTIEPVPYAVVFDGELPQRFLDVAAQRGVEHVIATETGEFVKKPIGVRIRTVRELLDQATAS